MKMPSEQDSQVPTATQCQRKKSIHEGASCSRWQSMGGGLSRSHLRHARMYQCQGKCMPGAPSRDLSQVNKSSTSVEANAHLWGEIHLVLMLLCCDRTRRPSFRRFSVHGNNQGLSFVGPHFLRIRPRAPEMLEPRETPGRISI